MGDRPQHRAAARASRAPGATAVATGEGSHTGRHRAHKRLSRRLSSRALGTLAAVATVGAVGAGVMSDAWVSAPPAAAGDNAPGPTSTPETAVASSEGADERSGGAIRRDPTLSRSATRAESRTTNRLPSWLQDCRVSTGGLAASNGQIPIASLCAIPDGPLLRGDAAAGWARLVFAYERAFDGEPCATGGYRSLGDQQRLYSTKPGLAARPGTSNHGWGVAVDLCGGVESFGTAQHQWMQQNAARYGWQNPGWAQLGGSRPEPWHWEFVGEPG